MSILESRKSLKLVILASALRNQKKEEEVKPEVNRRKENKEQRSVKQKTEKSSQAKSNSLKRSIKLINFQVDKPRKRNLDDQNQERKCRYYYQPYRKKKNYEEIL